MEAQIRRTRSDQQRHDLRTGRQRRDEDHHRYYTTNFDGKDQAVTGNPGTDTGSVKVLTPQVNEIIYKKAGKISQVLTNVLSLDGDTIGVMYMRMDPSGKVTNITVATYERMK